MQLTHKIVCERRNSHNTLTVKNDAGRPVKNLILISRVLGLGLESHVLGLGLGIQVLGLGLGLEPQVLVNITA